MASFRLLAGVAATAAILLGAPQPSNAAYVTNALSFNSLTANALIGNALTSNALTSNALTSNALTSNALTSNALTSNALSGSGRATISSAVSDLNGVTVEAVTLPSSAR